MVPVVSIVTASVRRVNMAEAVSHSLVHGRARGTATEVGILIGADVYRVMGRALELAVLRALHGLIELRAWDVALRRQHVVLSAVGRCLRIYHR